MKNNSTKYRYVEWLNTEEMHQETKSWLSELKFIRDEQFFLDDLVRSYTLQLIDSAFFNESKQIIEKIRKAEKDLELILKKVQLHETQLKIMMDGVDQLKMEKAYIETHKELINSINEYTRNYRNIKQGLFQTVSALMKKDKQKRLLN